MRILTNSVVFLVLLLAAFSILPAVQAHHYKPIQPGGLLARPCTFNFVFEDDQGAKYIGAAGHCSPRTGRRMVAPEIGEFGTVVYWRSDSANFTRPENASGPLMDFALVRIDTNAYDKVDPSMRFWGGPTGVATTYAAGTPTLHYGQGLIFQATEASRPRYGVLQEKYASGPFKDWYLASHILLGGDSGSGLLTGDGKALGIIDTVAVTFGLQPGIVGGPTIELVLRLLHQAGLHVKLVTAPFSPPSDPVALQQRITAMADHCRAQPQADYRHPDGCIRQQFYTYHSLSLSQNHTRWNPHPWAVMANSDPRICPETPWYPTLLEYPCQVHILIVETPVGFWETRAGQLDVRLKWASAQQDVDIYLYDSNGGLVTSNRTQVGNETSIQLANPPRDAYRLVIMPARYVETDMETLRGGDDRFIAVAELRVDSVPEPAATQGSDSTAKGARGVPSLPPVFLLAGLLWVAWFAGPSVIRIWEPPVAEPRVGINRSGSKGI